MARSIAARRHGDDFQARLFWLRAALLLDPHSNVTKVAYETGPKSFDDILVEYDLKTAPQDHEGRPILRRHIQSKWHTTAGVFGHADLIDPAFINAERYSLLQRAHLAQADHAPDGTGCRFELVTNWRIKADDPLLELVRKESDALDLARLFEGKTDRGRMGKVRKLWCEHLRVDHSGLALVARTLAVAEAPESLASLRERLDDRFAAVGMKRVPAGEAGFFYDDLAAKLLAQGRVEFDRDGFRKMAEREGLIDLSARPAGALAIGIRSFMHPIDPIEDRCARVLNFVPYFEGRYIRNDTDWQEQLHPALAAFVLDAARAFEHLRLIIDAHASLAFATGALLNVKSGKRIEIEQRFGGRRFWSMNDQTVDEGWPLFEFDEEIVAPRGDESALAIGLTHDVADGVRAFASARAPAIGRILHCRPSGRASQQSVVCGRHAWILAESVVRQTCHLRESGAAKGRVHLFIAGPNAFTFFLGQQQQALGPVSFYEWDFDGQRGGGYSLSLFVGG